MTDKEIFDRHMEVKGDSWIPEKFPARVMFVPIAFSKVICCKMGRAFGSKLLSGWDPLWPVALNAV